MRAVRSTENGIEVVNVTDSANDGVRVRVASSGICGSDLHMISYGPLAFTLGHEFCGRLDDGTPVAVLPIVACGTCDRCVAGDGQQCPQSFGAMYGISRDGGLADEVLVDPRCAKVLPDERLLEFGNLVEPLAVALHGVHRAGATSPGRVLVIGAGPVGLATIAVLSSMGIEVDLIARHTNRMEAGERLGAGTAPGSDYDIVLEAAGTQGSMDEAINRVRPGGTIGILGNFWDPISVGLGFQMKEATLVPAYTYGHHQDTEEFVQAIDVLQAVEEFPDVMITHHFALDDAAEAFRVAGDRSEGSIKVVVHP